MTNIDLLLVTPCKADSYTFIMPILLTPSFCVEDICCINDNANLEVERTVNTNLPSVVYVSAHLAMVILVV
mgnify:CR=1 FL=1